MVEPHSLQYQFQLNTTTILTLFINLQSINLSIHNLIIPRSHHVEHHPQG